MTEEKPKLVDDKNLAEPFGEINQGEHDTAGATSGSAEATSGSTEGSSVSAERTAASVAPSGPRSPSEIRANDILSFIVGVRKLSAQTLNVERNMRQIKNMSNVVFRHYIGYTAKGEYRIKHRKERCFSDEIKALGLEDPFDYVQSVSSSEKVGKVTDEKIPELVPVDGAASDKANGGKSEAPESGDAKAGNSLTGSPKKVDYLKGIPLVDLTDVVPDSVVLDSSLVVEEFPSGTLSDNCESKDLDSVFGNNDDDASGPVTFQPDGTVTFGDDETLISEKSDETLILPDDESKVPLDHESDAPSNDDSKTSPVEVSQDKEIHGVDKSD